MITMRERHMNIVYTSILFLLLLCPNCLALAVIEELHITWIHGLGYILLVLTGLFFPLLFLKPRTYFIVEGIFSFLLCPLEIACIIQYQQGISPLFLQTAFSTDGTETMELLQSLWWVGIFILVIDCIYFYIAGHIHYPSLLPHKIRIWGAGICLLICMGLYGAMWLVSRQYHNERNFTDLCRDAWTITISKTNKIYPYNLYRSIHKLNIVKREWQSQRKELADFRFGIKPMENSSAPLFILWIGEAARYDHWTFNGYNRPTSPRLDTTKNLISFSAFYTQANLTQYAVPLMLSRFTASEYTNIFREKCITDAFNEAGYSTAYMTKNSHSPYELRIMEDCDYHHISHRGFEQNHGYDEELLTMTKKHATGEGQFILLHSAGSHFHYNYRYPPDRAYFQPIIKNSNGFDIIRPEHKELLINSYDNSIRYTDSLLSELIHWTDSLDKQAVVVYVSDHGESFWDDSLSLSLHGSYLPSEAEYHIPFFVWYSDEYADAHPLQIEQLKAHRDLPLNTSTIFHTLLGLAGLENYADSTRNICSPYIHPTPQYDIIIGDGNIIKYTIHTAL